MARIDWVRQRLENWALWHERMNSGGIGWATRSAYLTERVDGDRPEARVPVDEVEAAITDEGVQSLLVTYADLHRTLTLIYLKGIGVAATARNTQRAVSTIHAQLAHADQLLATWFIERKKRKEAEASALRQQLEAARPVKLQGVVIEPPKRSKRTLRLGN
jgi:predicted metal-dependent TIM-barrel fold hydrolase